MSDSIKHECGIALIRLLKPLSYYQHKYGTALYGLNKLYLLMEKQHNRGQDGAGIATIKLDIKPGNRYISRYRAMGSGAVAEIFEHVQKKFANLQSIDLRFEGQVVINPDPPRAPAASRPAAGSTAHPPSP